MKKKQEEILRNHIRDVFSRVLECSATDIDINRSFSEQGGNSLKALQAIALLQQSNSIQISIPIFTRLSLVQLVRIILNKDSLVVF